MAQIFTSYSRRDTETVDTIVGEMTQAGTSNTRDDDRQKYTKSPGWMGESFLFTIFQFGIM